MTSRRPPISLAGSELDEVRHVCAFFNSEVDEYRVLLPFIKDGFACGERAIHVVSADQRNEHLKRLADAGIDVAAACDSGQLELHTSADTYLLDGVFDQDRMLQLFEQMASSKAAGPYSRSRIVCHMEWAAQDRAHSHDLVEFEARVNDVWRRHDDAVICVYDLAKSGGGTVIDILRTHPMVIIGDILQRNPFFAPPEEFLSELRARRDGGAPGASVDI